LAVSENHISIRLQKTARIFLRGGRGQRKIQLDGYAKGINSKKREKKTRGQITKRR